jgi:sec-independent protein translocase protein TatB
MLDVGFSEILLTSAIALIVLGPERLPKVARQIGNWVGRARVMARQLSEQLEREVNAEEIQKTQAKLNSLLEKASTMPQPAAAPTVAPATAPTMAPVPPEPHVTPAAATEAAPAEAPTVATTEVADSTARWEEMPSASNGAADAPGTPEAPPVIPPPDPIRGLSAEATTAAAMHASDPPASRSTHE